MIAVLCHALCSFVIQECIGELSDQGLPDLKEAVEKALDKLELTDLQRSVVSRNGTNKMEICQKCILSLCHISQDILI